MNAAKIIAECLQWLQMHQPALAQIEFPLYLNKAGIVPYHAESHAVLLMKPVARHKHLTPPGWQVAKGTRMVRKKNQWQDVTKSLVRDPESQIEPLACTALREGIEEVGLKLENIEDLKDLGAHTFYSSSTGKQKQMALFLCMVRNRNDFLEHGKIAASTAETGWFLLSQLPSDMRQDNLALMEAVWKS